MKKNFVLYQAIRFFRLRDSWERGARGFAVGLACNFYPTFGLGGIFLRPPIIVDDLGDVTMPNINALVWGKTFAIGSVLNSLIAGLLAYFLFLLAYERVRLPAIRTW